MKFEELNLSENLAKSVADAGFSKCTDIQTAVFGKIFNEVRDVVAQSQTGSGKTAAFLLTIFQIWEKNPEYKDKSALIIAPTRELAIQIHEEAAVLGKYLSYTSGCFYGGVGYTKQESILRNGCNLIVGTPGRLVDLYKKKELKLDQVGIVVVDEADRIFDMGFMKDINYIFSNLVPPEERTTMLFSATLSTRVRNLAWKFLKDPYEIEIESEHVTVDRIEQQLYHVGYDEKFSLLLGLLKKEKPESVLIFTNTKRTAYEVAKRLQINGYSAQYVIGDLPQKKRLSIINSIKDGELKFLVATDVAARGLHINDLELVINYDLPEDCENYVHRIGRTARAGKKGKAISLACERYVYHLEPIQSFIKQEIPVSWADDDLFVTDVSAKVRIDFSQFNKNSHPHSHSGTGKRNQGKVQGRNNRNQTRSKTNSVKENRNYQPKHNPAYKNAEKNIKNVTKPDAGSTLEDRISYYNKKYGDNFKVSNEKTTKMVKQRKTSVPKVNKKKSEKRFLRKVISKFKK